MNQSSFNEQINYWFKYPHKFALFVDPTYKDMSYLHDYWIRTIFYHYAFAKTKPNSLIEFLTQCHRDSYKTTSMLIGLTWILIFKPHLEISILQSSYELAVSRVKQIARIFQKDHVLEFASRVNGKEVKLVNDNVSNMTLSTCTNPTGMNLYAWGKGSNKTSRHPDILLIDDLANVNDMESQKHREDSKQVYRETTQLVGSGSLRVVTGTPWHEDDFYTLVKGQQLIYPLHEEKTIDAIRADPIAQQIINSKFEDKELIAILDSRHPKPLTNIEKFTPSYILYLLDSLPYYLFAKNYLLINVTPEGNILGSINYVPGEVKEWKKNKLCIERIYHIDKAFGGGDRIILTLAEKWAKKNDKEQIIGEYYYILGWSWTKKNIYDILPHIIKIIEQNDPAKILVEQNDDQGGFIEKVKDKFPQYYPLIRGYHENMSVPTKVNAYLVPKLHQILFDIRTDKFYIQQLKDWNDSKRRNDDAADSLASSCKYLTHKKIDTKKSNKTLQSLLMQKRMEASRWV